jgi:phage-related minor tail protein
MEFEAQKAINEKISSVWIEVDANRELLNLFESQKVVTQDDIEQIKVRAKLADEIAKVMANPSLSEEQKRISAELLTQAYAQKEIFDGRVKLAQKAVETEKAVRDAQKTESDSLTMEKRKLEIYSENLLMTEAEKDIALSRLETEQKIAAIRQKILDNPEFGQRGNDLIANQQLIQQRREEVIGLTERLKVLRDVNQAVFSNMENAITNFVKTGKLSFKDLTRSIIQDILAIYLKSQMLQMFKGFGGLFSGGGSVDADIQGGENFYGVTLPGKAGGGYISGPSIVGENGPELFIPRTAGTIIPNQQMAGMTSAPQVVYNGPYIANMQAIDTQSAAQFLARNKESVWAANQSASRSVPQSR